MLVLGITGDVGAGKSTITEIFKKRGARTLSADRIAHELWNQPEVFDVAVSRWGSEILLAQGSVDLKKIGSIIFSDKREYDWLCSFLHPLVRQESERRALSERGWVIAEIPLLFENGVPWWVDRILYVTASIENRESRNRKRNWDRDEILKREKFLMKSAEKCEKADLVLDNDDPLEIQMPYLEKLADKFRDLSSMAKFEAVFHSMEEAVMADKLLKKNCLVFESEITEPSVFNHKTGDFGKGSFFYAAVILERNYRKICESLEESGLDKNSGFTVCEIKRPGLLFRYFFTEESVT